MHQLKITVTIAAVISFLTFTGCEKRYTIEEVPLSVKNPTSYVFAFDTTQIRAAIDSVFHAYYWEIPAVLDRKMSGYFCSFASDSIIIEGKEILAKPENRLDACVRKMFYDESYVYTHDGGQPVYYSAIHHLHLTSVDENHTRIEVNTISPRIIVGVWGLNVHGLGGAYERSVQPSTIEEYQILRGIGRWLCVDKTMPPIELPVKGARTP